MLTELSLASDEFEHFAAQSHNSITFCLKEWRVSVCLLLKQFFMYSGFNTRCSRCLFLWFFFIGLVLSFLFLQGLLQFAESTDLPVSMYFDEPGKYVLHGIDFFSSSGEDTLTSKLCVFSVLSFFQ